MNEPEHTTAWARTVLADPRTVILDTETTGLGSQAEIIELAVLAPDGGILFNSRFRPTAPIEPGALAIHHITAHDVESAPLFAERWSELVALLDDKRVVTYNADFDRRLLTQTLLRYGLSGLAADLECAMTAYAAWYGEWSEWHGSYRYQSLANAAATAGGDPSDHTALGDARACLSVLRFLAGQRQAAMPM